MKRVVAVWGDFFHFGIPRSQGKIWGDTDRFPSNWKEQISCSRLFRPAVRADGNKITAPLRHRVESYVVRSNVLTFSLRMVSRKFKNWCYVLTYILRIKLDSFFFNFFLWLEHNFWIIVEDIPLYKRFEHLSTGFRTLYKHWIKYKLRIFTIQIIIFKIQIYTFFEDNGT